MTLRVAVEDGLTQVKQALRDNGYQITKFTEGTMSNVDCAVITGLSNNMLGIADTMGNKFPVVNADGMTADEVVSTIQARLKDRT